MSVDVFFWPFRDGDMGRVDPQQVARLLAPALVQDERGFTRLVFADGSAQLYGLDELDTGFMVNHVDGFAAWDFLVGVADEAALAIVTPGCPAAVTRSELLAHLPDLLREDAVVVTTGSQLLASQAGA